MMGEKFRDLFCRQTDIRDAMLGKNASVWIRIEFQADRTEVLDTLRLDVLDS